MIPANLEQPLNPSTLMLHCPHLIISHVMVSRRQAKPALLLPAHSLLHCLPRLFLTLFFFQFGDRLLFYQKFNPRCKLCNHIFVFM